MSCSFKIGCHQTHLGMYLNLFYFTPFSHVYWLQEQYCLMFGHDYFLIHKIHAFTSHTYK